MHILKEKRIFAKYLRKGNSITKHWQAIYCVEYDAESEYIDIRTKHTNLKASLRTRLCGSIQRQGTTTVCWTIGIYANAHHQNKD